MNNPVIIGNATLYLGDCREILPTLNPVDMIFTDPPYGHNNNNGDLIHNWEKALGVKTEVTQPGRPIMNDGPEANDLFRKVLADFYRILKSPGCCCCCCCCGGGGPDPQFARWSLWLDEVFKFKQMIIWDKGPMGMGWHYRRSYETVLIGEKPGKSKWFDDTNKIENIIRPGMHGINKIIPTAEDHPTPKPPELAAFFIKLHTQPGEIVLDSFMGTGSTGVAAMNLGRKFIGVEIEERYFDIACRRIEDAQRQQRMFA